MRRKPLSGWTKVAKTGKKYINLSFKPESETRQPSDNGGSATAHIANAAEQDKDIPFVAPWDVDVGRGLPHA